MPTKPQPTVLKMIRGNPGRRPLNKREPKPAQRMPEPPPELIGDALAEWHRTGPELYRVGVLTVVDRAVLAAYCDAYGKWVTALRLLNAAAVDDRVTEGLLVKTIKNNWIYNPLVGVAHKARADMVRFAAELGMTPSARSGIKADPVLEDDDPSAKYFA